MQELLYINPKRRTRRASTAKRHTRRANPRRRRNPIAARVHHKVRRLSTHHHRRRRNPISLKGEGIGEMLKTAVLAGAGSVSVDAIMGQVRPMLPASVQTGYEYTAVKAGITVGLGILAKHLLGAKGTEMAQGALIVQAAMLITSMVPSSMTLAGRQRILGAPQAMRGLGYFNKGGGAMLQAGSVNSQIAVPKMYPAAGPRLGYFNASNVRRREGSTVR